MFCWMASFDASQAVGFKLKTFDRKLSVWSDLKPSKIHSVPKKLKAHSALQLTKENFFDSKNFPAFSSMKVFLVFNLELRNQLKRSFCYKTIREAIRDKDLLVYKNIKKRSACFDSKLITILENNLSFVQEQTFPPKTTKMCFRFVFDSTIWDATRT